MFRILVLVGALAAGGVAAWLSFGLQPDPAPAATLAAPVPQIRTQEVLVAALDLEQGMTLTDQDLHWQTWPEASVNGAFITRSGRPEAVEDLTGSVVRQAMMSGEPVHDGKLANTDSGYLAALLKSGMRAVAVRVSAETSAGGFILPNDRVDVLHTGGDGGARSRTILTNIRVLAIDQNAVDSGADAESAVGKTATLELTSEQAEVISGAQSSGSLSLALRATVDNDEIAPATARRSAGVDVRIVRAGQSETVATDGLVQ
jgi:pilus assembly protein CpaB